MVRPFVHLLGVYVCAEKRAYTSSGIYDTSYLSHGRTFTLFTQYGLTAFVALPQDVTVRQLVRHTSMDP